MDHDAAPADKSAGSIHVLPQGIDIERVAAHDQGSETGVDAASRLALNGGTDQAGGAGALGNAAQSAIRMDLDDTAFGAAVERIMVGA